MSVFHFKQFSIEQNLCAMKVGTDGVLLGSWTNVPDGNVLDIGSGSGLISLMIAQRNSKCNIDAIDIDEGAFMQTKLNIEKNNKSNFIRPLHTPLQGFKNPKNYNLIVSNPPFFSNCLKSNNTAKNTARHTDTLSFDDLLYSVSDLLSPEGIFSVILPVVSAKEFIESAKTYRLNINRVCEVKPNYSTPPKRSLMEFSFKNCKPKLNLLTIETNQRHEYTEEYKLLTQNFYLKF